MTRSARAIPSARLLDMVRAAALVLAAALAGCTTPEGPHAARYMIAAANPLAAAAGRDILRAGGSAVDAAIAAQMVLTLVEPQSSGIGGGGFLLHMTPGSAENRSPPVLAVYDGRETAPQATAPTLFLDAGGQALPFADRVAGGNPVGVPGLVRMLAEAHARHGRLPWRDLFQPAIRLAEQGFPVSPRLYALLAADRRLKDFPPARAYFFNPDGAPLPAGHILRNPALADTLRRVAEGGADAFYTGAIAADIAAAVRAAPQRPGMMTAADLSAYRAVVRAALCIPYRVWRVCGVPPPSSGAIAVGQMLSFLAPYDMGEIGTGSALGAHLLAEAGRLAFADRSQYLADPAFVRVPTEGLLDPGYLSVRAGMISTLRSMGRAGPGVPPGMQAGRHAPDGETEKAVSTSHLSVVDARGNAVALTSSIGTPFGSRLMVRGFLLNNQLTDFAAQPVIEGKPVANAAAGGKRPLSSMAPTIVFTEQEGRFVLALGSPGGLNITGYVARALVAALDENRPLARAFAAPNLLNRNGPTVLERGTAAEGLAAPLRALGHEIDIRPLESGLHGIRLRGELLEGGADPRREGVAIGD